jgi:glycosyltransferase involved in cell wall biosynthesis
VGGVNSFTVDLVNGLLKNEFNYSYTIFCTEENYEFLQNHFSKKENINFLKIDIRQSVVSRIIKKVSYLIPSLFIHEILVNFMERKISKKIDENCEVLYVPTTLLFPYKTKVPQVLSMHDAQHFHFPHFFSKKERIVRHFSFYVSFKNASIIQVSSDYIKNDFKKIFKKFDQSKVKVITEGVDLDFFNRPAKITSEVLKKYNIPSMYVFMPAQFWPHKNHMLLLKTIVSMNNQGFQVPVVFTGGDYGKEKEIQNFVEFHNLRNVFFLGKVPREELKELFWNTSAFISTSLHESSSLPLREAAACGAPIIVSSIDPNKEIDQLLEINLFDTDKNFQLEEILIKLIKDSNFFKLQTANNLEKINHFSWKNITKQYAEIFDSI